MGISSDGILCFGIDLGEEPFWKYTEDDEGYDDMEEWWLDISGYQEINNDIYDESGNHSKTFTTEKRTERYNHRQKYLETTLPVEEVMHCHYECPMYILAIKNTCLTANRGYPNELNLEEMNKLVTSEKKKELEDFARKYIFKNGEEIKMTWYLCSIMG